MQGIFKVECKECKEVFEWAGDYMSCPPCPECGDVISKEQLQEECGRLALYAYAFTLGDYYDRYLGFPLTDLSFYDLNTFIYCSERLGMCESLDELKRFGGLVRGEGYATKVVRGLRKLYQDYAKEFRVIEGVDTDRFEIDMSADFSSN